MNYLCVATSSSSWRRCSLWLILALIDPIEGDKLLVLVRTEVLYRVARLRDILTTNDTAFINYISCRLVNYKLSRVSVDLVLPYRLMII